jgi:hypothetical protein
MKSGRNLEGERRVLVEAPEFARRDCVKSRRNSMKAVVPAEIWTAYQQLLRLCSSRAPPPPRSFTSCKGGGGRNGRKLWIQDFETFTETAPAARGTATRCFHTSGPDESVPLERNSIQYGNRLSCSEERRQKRTLKMSRSQLCNKSKSSWMPALLSFGPGDIPGEYKGGENRT